MIFDFFSVTDVRQFSESIAVEYDRLRRSTMLRADTEEKQQRKFDKLAEKVNCFSLDSKLNFYKKAKLLFFVKHALTEKNIPQTEITDFIRSVLGRSLR